MTSLNHLNEQKSSMKHADDTGNSSCNNNVDAELANKLSNLTVSNKLPERKERDDSPRPAVTSDDICNSSSWIFSTVDGFADQVQDEEGPDDVIECEPRAMVKPLYSTSFARQHKSPYTGYAARDFVHSYNTDSKFKARHDKAVHAAKSDGLGYCFTNIARLPGDQIKLSVVPCKHVTLEGFLRSDIVVDMMLQGKLVPGMTIFRFRSDVDVFHLAPGNQFNVRKFVRMANGDIPIDAQYLAMREAVIGATCTPKDAAMMLVASILGVLFFSVHFDKQFGHLVAGRECWDRFREEYNDKLISRGYNDRQRSLVLVSLQNTVSMAVFLMAVHYWSQRFPTTEPYALMLYRYWSDWMSHWDVTHITGFFGYIMCLFVVSWILTVVEIYTVFLHAFYRIPKTVWVVFFCFVFAPLVDAIPGKRVHFITPTAILASQLSGVDAVTAAATGNNSNNLLITIVVAFLVSVVTVAFPELGKRLERMLRQPSNQDREFEMDLEGGHTARRVKRSYSADAYGPFAMTKPSLKPEAKRRQDAQKTALLWAMLYTLLFTGFIGVITGIQYLVSLFDRVNQVVLRNQHPLDPEIPADIRFFYRMYMPIRRLTLRMRRNFFRLVVRVADMASAEICIFLHNRGLLRRESMRTRHLRLMFIRRNQPFVPLEMQLEEDMPLADLGQGLIDFVGSPVYDVLVFATSWASDAVHGNNVPAPLRVASVLGIVGRLYKFSKSGDTDRIWTMIYETVFGANLMQQADPSDEKGIKWASTINETFRSWVTASMKGKSVAAALLALVSAVPLIVGGYEAETVKEWIVATKERLSVMPTLERFVDAALEMTATVVKMAGYPSLCRNITALLYSNGPETLYSEANEAYMSLLGGTTTDVASALVLSEKAHLAFFAEGKKAHKTSAERAHCANRCKQLREMSSELEALLRSFRERFHTIVIFIYGESQLGKSTMIEYLVRVLSAKLNIEPTLFHLPPVKWDDGLMPFHNFISLDDVNSCDSEENEPPLDKLRRLANVVNQPVNHSEAGKRGLIFHNAKFMFVTANNPNLNSSKKVTNPEAGVNRINVCLKVTKNAKTGEQVGNRWLPKKRNERNKAIPDHLKFQSMEMRVDKTQTVQLKEVGKAISFENWIDGFVEKVEAMYHDRVKRFKGAASDDEICQHHRYMGDCDKCRALREVADQAPEAAGAKVVCGAAGTACGVWYARMVEATGLHYIANMDYESRSLLATSSCAFPLMTFPIVVPWVWCLMTCLSICCLASVIATEPYRRASRVSSSLFMRAAAGSAYLGKRLAAVATSLIVLRGIRWYRSQVKRQLQKQSLITKTGDVGAPVVETTAAQIKARVITEKAEGKSLFPWIEPIRDYLLPSKAGQGSSIAAAVHHCDKRIWLARAGDGSSYASRLVHFQTGVMLLNKHNADEMKKINSHLLDHFSEVVAKDGTITKKKTTKKVEFDWSAMAWLPGQDLCLVRVIAGLGAMDSLLQWLSDSIGPTAVDGTVRLGDFHAGVSISTEPMSETFEGSTWARVSQCSALIPSSVGFCGSPVVANHSKTIVGIHCGGDCSTKWWYALLSRKDAETMLTMLGYVPPAHKAYKREWKSAPNRDGEEHPSAVHNYLTGDAEVHLEGFTTRVPPGKTNMVSNPYWPAVRSQFSDLPAKSFVAPAFQHSNVVLRGIMIASNTPLGRVPWDVHCVALKAMLERIKSAVVCDDIRRVPISVDEALNGIPGSRYHHGIKRQTGGGWPLLAKKTRLFVLLPDERVRLTDEAQTDLNDILTNVYRGEVSATVGHLLMKDEPLRTSKIKEELNAAIPRGFVCDAWAFYLVCSMYLEPVMAVMLDNPGVFNHCLAIDPLGSEWEEYVARYDGAKEGSHLPCDYSAFDWNHEEKSAEFVATLFAAVAKDHLEYDQVMCGIVFRLVWECCHRSINFNGAIVSAWFFWTSGNKITALAGALKNCYWFSCVFTMMNPDKKVWDHLIFSALGDDCWPALKEGSDARWEPSEIVEYFSTIGFKVTPETKDGEVRCVPGEDVVMLRRTTKFNPELGYRVGALDKVSIMRPFEMWEDTPDPHTKFNEIVSSALREMVAHGRHDFDNFALKISRVMTANNIPIINMDHFSYVYQIDSISGANPERWKRNFNLKPESGTVDVSPGETETQENVHVEAPQVEESAWEFRDGTILSDTHSHRAMPPIIHREVLVAKETIPLNVYEISSFAPALALYNNAVIRERLEHHHAGSFELKVRVAVACSRFHSGRLRLWYTLAPHILDRWGDSTVDYTQRAVVSASRQHVDVEIAEEGAAELTIPFFDPRGKIYFSEAALRDYVTVHLDIIAPARHMADPAESPTITVYTNFVNMNVVGNVGARFQTVVTSPKEAPASKPSVLMGRVSTMANTVARFPPLAVPAQVVSDVAGVLGSMAKLFGRSRPMISGGHPYVPVTASSFSSANQGHAGNALSFDCMHGVAMDSRMGGEEVDIMSYEYFSSMPAPIWFGVIVPGDPLETPFFSIPLTPMIGVQSDSYLLPLPCAIPAMVNNFWKATMMYRLVFTCPMPIGGRVRVLYDAADGTGANHTVNDTWLLDLKVSRELCIEIQMCQPDNFLRCGDFTSPFGVWKPDCHNGTLLVQMETPLTSTQAGFNVDVRVDAWCKDFCYGSPDYSLFDSYSLRPYEDPPETSDDSVYNYLFPSGVGEDRIVPGPSDVPTSAPLFSTNRPTASPTRLTAAPTVSPTQRPSLRGTSSPTALPTLAGPAYDSVSVPVELWGSNNNGRVQTDGTIRIGGNSLSITTYSVGGSVIMTTNLEASGAGVLLLNSLGNFNYQLTLGETFGTGNAELSADGGSLLSVIANIPSALEYKVAEALEVARDLAGRTLTEDGFFTAGFFQSFVFTPPDISAHTGGSNYVGFVMKGEATIAIGSSLTPVNLNAFRTVSFEVPQGQAVTVTVQSPSAGGPLFFVASMAWLRVKLRREAGVEENPENTFRVLNPQHVEEDLMKVHVGEWNQTLLLHVKVPMLRDPIITTDPQVVRALYDEPSRALTPWNMVFSMYGGYRGGVVRTLESMRNVLRVYVTRSGEPSASNLRYRGREILQPQLNAVMTFHAPFFSRFRFLYGRDSRLHYEDNYLRYEIVREDTAQGVSLNEYHSVGEDFSPLLFLGPPFLVRS